MHEAAILEVNPHVPGPAPGAEEDEVPGPQFVQRHLLALVDLRAGRARQRQPKVLTEHSLDEGRAIQPGARRAAEQIGGPKPVFMGRTELAQNRHLSRHRRCRGAGVSIEAKFLVRIINHW